MKILVVSDEESPALWDYYTPGKLDGYDLILSCGDLKAEYLSFLVTMGKCPVLYVHGNHDTAYDYAPPEGCDCIDGKVVVYNGLRLVGLGGCLRYHPGTHQYTDREMGRRIRSLRRALWKTKGVDVVVTHAPPRGVGDGEDPAHIGFSSLLSLLDKYRPAYLVHGHVHLRYGVKTRENSYGDTAVINCTGRYELVLPDKPFAEKQRGRLIWKNGAPKTEARERGYL